MGRSISKAFFGQQVGKLAVKYHNGTNVVSGYIVRQIGTTRYEVTTDGVTTYVVSLAQTTEKATSLTAGFGTIEASNAFAETVHISKLEMNLASTTEGRKVNWRKVTGDDRVVVSSVQAPVVIVIPEPTASLSIDTIVDQVAGVEFTVLGYYTGTAPTKMQVQVGADVFVVITDPVIEFGAFSFKLTVAAEASGVIVQVRDYTGDVVGVNAISNAFVVIAA